MLEVLVSAVVGFLSSFMDLFNNMLSKVQYAEFVLLGLCLAAGFFLDKKWSRFVWVGFGFVLFLLLSSV